VAAVGGGLGVALLLFTTEPELPHANALKNMLIGAASVIAWLACVVLEPVDWAAVAPLSAGMLAGSMLGPPVTRRVPPAVMRWLIAMLGVVLAVRRWLDPASETAAGRQRRTGDGP
jgi:uncharacterized membrane protein YfcA